MRNPLDQFADEVLDVMPLMFREFARREDNALAQGKISCPQMVAMNLAAERGEVTVGEIVRQLSSEKSAVSVLLERLVKQGLMRRRHDDKDRRLVWMSLTPKGRKVIDQILSQKRISLKAIFKPIPQREREQYLAVLRKVKLNLMKGCAVLLAAVLLGAAPAQAFQWPWQKKEAAPAVSAPAAPVISRRMDLVEAYRKALERSESVAITREEIELAQARFYRSFDYFLPQVRYEITRFEHDVDDDGTSGGEQNFGRRTTPSQKFVFSQPLFSGFREYAALLGTGADKKAQRLKYRRAQELLFVDVMESYYTVLNGEKDVETLYAVHRLLSERMRDIRERVDLGRSRESELKTSLAEIKILESDLLDAKRVVTAARNLLEFYIGEELDGVILTDENGEGADLLFRPGIEQTRADVVQYEQEFLVAKNKRVAANASYLPVISLDGNYYTKRVGFQSGNQWDVTLKFDIPVFEAGEVFGEIKEADANLVVAKLAYEQKKRQAALEARDAFEEFESDLASEEALSEASRASQDNYEILQKEFSTNLVNNLDVLDALRRYQDTRRRYEQARYGAKKSYWRLKLALGEISVS